MKEHQEMEKYVELNNKYDTQGKEYLLLWGVKKSLIIAEKASDNDSQRNCSEMELGNTSLFGALPIRGVFHAKWNVISFH